MITKQALLNLVSLAHDLNHPEVFSVSFDFIGLRDSFILTVRIGPYDNANPPTYFEIDENIMHKMTLENIRSAHDWLLDRYDEHAGINPF